LSEDTVGITLLTRRRFLQGSLTLAGVGLLAGCGRSPFGLSPQPITPRIGFLASGPSSDRAAVVFKRAMVELGYAPGETVLVEERYADGRVERLPDLAVDLVHRNVDVIVAAGIQAALASRDASQTIPIVAVLPLQNDPVQRGLVVGLAHPGGNLTGLVAAAPSVWGKRLELLAEAVPSVSRVAVVWNTKTLGHGPWDDLAEEHAGQLRVFDVGTPAGLDGTVEAAVAWGAEALITSGSAAPTQIASLALNSRLPAISDAAGHARAGLLLAYASDAGEMYEDAATFVDRILQGAKPADLPFQQSTAFDLVLNLKTAQALGLAIPHGMLIQVTDVVQ